MMKILLIDDDILILKGLRNMILSEKNLFAEVVCAEGGEEAIELFETSNADLAIVDINMPQLNGLEVIAEARKRGLCNRFIILSAYSRFEYARQAIRDHVMDYLVKPVDRDVLVHVLHNVSEEISGKREIRQKAMEKAIHDLLPLLPNPRVKSETTNNILQYVRKRHTKIISLQDIAMLMHMHPNYVCKLFHKEMGISFIKYVNLFRVHNLAKKLLMDHNCKLKYIYEDSGFLSERQFYRIFKLHTGMTPMEFRTESLALMDEDEIKYGTK